VTQLVPLLHPVPSLATVAVALLFLPLVAGGVPPLRQTVLLALSLALQQFAISAHNDWCDRDLDAVAKPSRPIPSGRIAGHAVLALAAALSVGSLLLAAQLGSDEVALVALFLVSGLVYNARLKRTTFSWLPFSLAFPLIPLFAAAALDTWPTWWPAAALAAQPLIVAIHLADSIPDIETDLRAGAGGLATRLGARLATRLRNAGVALSALALAGVALLWRP
jgi:4-hydroxybenzoate polyprenyltransferase